MFEKVTYICENCNTAHDRKEDVHKCDICGEDYCRSCTSQQAQDDEVCDDCDDMINKLIEKQDQNPFGFVEKITRRIS